MIKQLLQISEKLQLEAASTPNRAKQLAGQARGEVGAIRQQAQALPEAERKRVERMAGTVEGHIGLVADIQSVGDLTQAHLDQNVRPMAQLLA